MRKEQQKALQEKHKSDLKKPKADTISDISVLLDDTKEEKGILDRENELDSTNNPSISSIDGGKCALPSQATCRPLVPPGFRNTVLEKNSGESGLKSLNKSHSVEVGNFYGILTLKNIFIFLLEREYFGTALTYLISTILHSVEVTSVALYPYKIFLSFY